MSNWAEIVDGKVRRITGLSLGDDAFEKEWLENNLSGIWIKSSNDYQPRKTFAVVGYSLSADGLSFVPPKPFDSWNWNEELWSWQAPLPKPEGDAHFIWNETATSWVELT